MTESLTIPRPPAALAIPIASTERRGAPDPRAELLAAASIGYRAVQLDAASPGLRPRELDRSARRDLAALLRRLQLHFAGVDLWIPPEHLVDPAHAERAIAAIEQGISLVADLDTLVGPNDLGVDRGRVVCVRPPEKLGSDTISHLSSVAGKFGVRLVDFAYPSPFAVGEGAIGQGIDPAALLATGADPVAAVSTLTAAPAAVRLTDLDELGRVLPGSRRGRLDLDAFAAVLTVRGFKGCVVVDTRGLAEPHRASQETLKNWGGGRSQR